MYVVSPSGSLDDSWRHQSVSLNIHSLGLGCLCLGMRHPGALRQQLLLLVLPEGQDNSPCEVPQTQFIKRVVKPKGLALCLPFKHSNCIIKKSISRVFSLCLSYGRWGKRIHRSLWGRSVVQEIKKKRKLKVRVWHLGIYSFIVPPSCQYCWFWKQIHWVTWRLNMLVCTVKAHLTSVWLSCVCVSVNKKR